MSTALGQIFILQNYGIALKEYAIITSIGVSQEDVTAAWSYAVRYTAKGIDLPDHEAAAKLLIERHPSWQILKTTVMTIAVNLAFADKDQPES